MKPTTLLCAACIAACANVASPTPTERSRLAEAQALLAEDPHKALDITDELLAHAPHWRDARWCAAEGSRLLAARSAGNQAAFLLQDAARNLEVLVADAGAGKEPEAWQQLAECRYELGEFDPAAAAARQAAAGFAALRTQAGRQRAAGAILLAGRADLRTFAAAREAELASGERDPRGVVVPSKAVAAQAQRAVAQFESARGEFPAEACTQIAVVWQFLGMENESTAEYERGLRSSPDTEAIHSAYIGRMIALGQQQALVGAYAGFVRESPAVPLLHWFQGEALYARADQLRSVGDQAGAIAAYARARAGFGEYAAMVPGHRDSAARRIAQCELSIARSAVESGDFARARAHLFAADEASPAAVAYLDGAPQLVDSFGSHYAGVVFAMNRALAESGVDGVEKALEFNEAVLARHPDRFGFVYNNAALPARDLGVRLADAGRTAAAMELWERSYRYYEKAVALSPDDARIANDCGLVLIYHLNRDFGRARELFERAIALGTRQLADLPADADRRERELLEEAVGDAWQNIAVLLRKHEGKPFADYREYCEQAVKYYPCERRAAAALLRSEGADDGDSPAVTAARQGGAKAALDEAEPKVKAKAEAGDLDGALALLDEIAGKCKDYAPFHARRGELTLQLANQSRDQGRKGTDLFYQEAVASLQRAVALDGEPIGPRQLLGQALYENNDLEGAAGTMSALLLHLQSKGGGKAEEQSAAHVLRANAAARAYAGKKSAQQDDAGLLAAARTSFRALEQQGRLDAALAGLWSATEQWAGAPAEAVNVFVRALRKAPEDQALLNGLVDTAANTQQLPLAAEALRARGDATAQWYLGKVHYLVAAQQREAGKTDEALQTLGAARSCFAESMQKNKDYRASCEQWISWCLGKMGNIAFRTEDLANAEQWLLEAVRLGPGTIDTDLGLGETIKLGILLVADKHYRQRDLARVEAIYRAASDAAKTDLDLLNNAGLFARDHGNQLEAAGRQQEAMAMYEQSYKAYRAAVQLDGRNVRLRNDCALIAIHYLGRDWELTKPMLVAAIADGEKTLAEDPPQDVQEKQNLDEAVGDCYENLALWQLRHGKDYVAAKAAAQKSMAHYPGQRRPGARQHLREAERLLQGK